jgi:hypothetical protein
MDNDAMNPANEEETTDAAAQPDAEVASDEVAVDVDADEAEASAESAE